MVAIFTGIGWGVERGSGYLLGSRGQLGDATLGRYGDNVSVNAANGNLVVQRTDEILIGEGPDDVISRAYNSRSDHSDDNGDNWMLSAQRRVVYLTGTVNTTGSTVTRFDVDGSDTLYKYDATARGGAGAYVCNQTAGIYDQLTYTSGTWTWTDGDTNATETYDATNGGRLMTSMDTNGHTLTYAYYVSGLLRQVMTANGDHTDLIWSGTNLLSISTTAAGMSGAYSVISYAYDVHNRLVSATTDLTPTNSTDSSAITTSYTYDASGRLATITQTGDPSGVSALSIAYDTLDRVVNYTQTISSVSGVNVTNTTTLSYGTGYTLISDQQGNLTRLYFDGFNRLTQAWLPPAQTGTPSQFLNFGYNADGDGNVLMSSDGNFYSVSNTYNSAGALLIQEDMLGNTITRTYDTNNRVLTETHSSTPIPNSAWHLAGAGDFDGDHQADLLWVTDAGQVAITFMNGLVAKYSVFADMSQSSSWHFKAIGDFNNDGMADILWQNDNGIGDVWEMSGAHVLVAGGFGAADPTWHFKATGDFNGDHKSDILVQNDDGSVAAWTMNGISRTAVYAVGTNPGTAWSAFATGDFDGDTNTDILLSKTDGSTQVWFMSGTTFSSAATSTGASAPYHPIATGYFDSDHMADVLWQYTNGAGQVSLMHGATQYDNAGWNDAGPTFTFLGTADFNGDGKSDILMKDTNGNAAAWIMDGATRIGGATIGGPAGLGITTATVATTHYVYDSAGNLRFTVSPMGEVTEYQRDSVTATKGNLLSTIVYRDNTYGGTTFSESDLATWAAGLTDKSTVERTDMTYDAVRGTLVTATTYATATMAGVGNAGGTDTFTRTTYNYSPFGTLLSRSSNGATGTEVYTYDGFGRMTMATDLAGSITLYSYSDTGNSLSVTLANGLTQVSQYNLAGDLVSYAESGTGVTTATTTEAYDNLDRLRSTTDPTGVITYFLYDTVGRKIADIATDGDIVEYKYDLDDRLVATVQYATKLTTAALNSLVSGGQPANVTLASVRPASSSGDLWSWNVYDAASRVIETIDGNGDAKVFTYDPMGTLRTTSYYANAIAAATVATFKTSPPTTLQLPTASTALDSVARNYYDLDGRLIATADERHLVTQYIYNAAGEQTEKIQYGLGTTATAALNLTGTFAQLVTSLPSSPAEYQYYNVYDDRGLLRYSLIPYTTSATPTALRPVEYVYDDGGRLTETIQYSGTIAPPSAYTAALVAGQITATTGLATNPLNRESWSIYDPASGRLAYAIDPTGAVTYYKYDSVGEVVQTIAYATPLPRPRCRCTPPC